MCVVVADLVVGGKHHGPHGFLMEMRREEQLVPGVTAGDMGDKTIGNDLDNAWGHFDGVQLPKDALLDRYGGIENGKYVQRVKGVRTMEMIGQRLYTGRTVIAQSTLVFARTLFAQTKVYSDGKKCWDPSGGLVLSEVPQLQDLFKDADAQISRVEAFAERVETRLCECLRADKLPSPDLVEAVAVLKVKAIETSIEQCFRLKQEVGSYALMGGTGFEKLDYLQCCKFAEGDSRILMQKMARDRLQAFSKGNNGSEAENKICIQLGQALKVGGQKAWNPNWRLVYGLAEAVMERVLNTPTSASRL